MVDDFYAKIKQGDYEGTLSLYHDKWFNVASREQTLSFLKKIDEKLGVVQTYELSDWNSQSYVGIGGSGNYVTLAYSVNRTRYNSTERFTIFNPQGTDAFYILGYDVNSMGLVE